jgi:tripartite-type tricarboxylate transporter receptor subunit TctC
VASLERSSALPDVPTIDTSGLKGYQVAAWGGFVVPARTPRPIIDKLNAAANAAIKLPEIADRMRETGGEPQGGSPERFGEWIRQELAHWKAAVKAAGVEAQ